MLKILLVLLVVVLLSFLILRFLVVPRLSKLPKNITAPVAEQANHTLSPCPDKPNCVSSTATKSSQKVAPLNFDGAASEAIAKLKNISTSQLKGEVINEQANYLHVVFKSKLMNYVDDTEFYAEENTKLIQVRSAARLGHSDLNKNWERVEFIRKAFEK